MLSAAAKPTAAVMYSEIILSLYPILIKSVSTNLFTQTFARFLVFPILALAAGGIKESSKAWATPKQAGHSTAFGAMNLLHIAASYRAFHDLPAGIAMSIFYTYPIWNVIGARIFFGETIPFRLLPFFALAIAGTYLIATSDTSQAAPHKTKTEETDISSSAKTARGVAAALIAALTETGLFLAVRGSEFGNPFASVQQFYPAGLAFMILAAIGSAWAKGLGSAAPALLDLNWRNWIPLIVFNAVLGFTGYTARFFSIPNLPTIIFSILSFVGVMASYVWGSVFAGETPGRRAIIGSGVLSAAIAGIRLAA